MQSQAPKYSSGPKATLSQFWPPQYSCGPQAPLIQSLDGSLSLAPGAVVQPVEESSEEINPIIQASGGSTGQSSVQGTY